MNQRTRTITILFTDIEGSTRLWEEYPEAMDDALRAHDAILNGIIASHQGIVIKTTGDGIHAVFDSAHQAVEAVIAAQRALLAHAWADLPPLKVRMALHTGEVISRQGDYYGPAVNRAARLMALAAGEQILLSATTADLVRDRLAPESTLTDLGRYQLKNLSRPEQVFQLAHPALPADFPPLGSQRGAPNNLPDLLTSFIGREQEVAEIVDALTGPETRLLTLTGPGGVGKTRLSLCVAEECLRLFSDGIFFVPLAQIRDAAFVASAIMQALRLPAAGSRPAIEQLKTHLVDSTTLLVLDNFEHVPDARVIVSELLSATSRLKVMATSRSSLSIYGEQIIHISPLKTPDSTSQRSYEELTLNPAVRLFLERARAVKRDLVFRDEEAETVAQICARLDGLPLAIELAAVRIRLLTPQEILARLDQGIHFLRGGARDLPERQQTLRATIQWSIDLLSPADKTLFRRMAVFVGGCSLEAAVAVCDLRSSSVDGEIDVLDGVERLIDHSLIGQSTIDDQARFFMLETIHEFALEQMLASEEADEVRRYHADYYLSLAQKADSQIIGLEQGFWLERLDLEHGNLRIALAWSLENDPNTALKIATSLRRFWHYRGYLQEGFNWFIQALDRRMEFDTGEDAVLARGLTEAGNIAWFYGDVARSYEYQRKSVDLWRKLGDRRGHAYALWQLGKATWTAQGDLASARKLIQESVGMLREMDDKVGLANALFWGGFLAFLDQASAQARADLEESRDLAAEVNFMNILAADTSVLGRIDFRQDDYASAHKNFEQSLALFRELEDLIGISIVASVFGELLHVLGDYERAETCYRESMDIDKVVFGEGDFLHRRCVLGLALCRQEKFNEARQQLRGGLKLLDDEQDRMALYEFGIALAVLEAMTGHSLPAAELLGRLESMEVDEGGLDKVFRVEYERIRNELARRLGEEAFKAGRGRGRELNDEQLHELFLAATGAP